MVTSSPVSFPVVPRAAIKERFGPAIISGFVATTAMAITALIAYGFALGVGTASGNLFQQWLYALTHNPVTAHARASLLAVVGLDGSWAFAVNRSGILYTPSHRFRLREGVSHGPCRYLPPVARVAHHPRLPGSRPSHARRPHDGAHGILPALPSTSRFHP